MSSSTPASDLPEFDRPPVVEVSLSAIFHSLKGLTSGHVGSFWLQHKNRFPKTFDHSPLDSPRELKDERKRRLGARIQVQQVPVPRLRTWFVTEDGSELVQVQHDRFARNWRQSANAKYPRYPNVRRPFETDFQLFREFVEAEKLGPLSVEQCEISYSNHIEVRSHSELGRVFRLWGSSTSALPPIEDGQFTCRFVIGDGERFLGRLHVSVQPAYRQEQPIFITTLTARGEPLGDSAMGFFDLGHQWIVRGFAEITTEEMHNVWGRSR